VTRRQYTDRRDLSQAIRRHIMEESSASRSPSGKFRVMTSRSGPRDVWRSAVLPPVGIFALAILAVGFVSLPALTVAALDGIAAGVVMVPCMLGGLWLVPLVLNKPMPLRWHLLLGSALGLGATSIGVLSCGLFGLLDRTFWLVYLGVAGAMGLLRLLALLRREDSFKGESGDGKGALFLWLAAVPFLVLAILAAGHAPGFLWREEGFGYDVLEYHLQIPREYSQNGRIAYTAHNVYGSFPASVEMFYLLAMIVHQDVLDIGTVAHMIHLDFGVLTIFAAWVSLREGSRIAGVIVGLVLATTGWLVYVSGLAYVENGILFFGITAMAAVLRVGQCKSRSQETTAKRQPKGSAVRWSLVAGLCAGFACGCKYTAVPMIAFPLAAAAWIVGRGLPRTWTLPAMFLIGSAAPVSPWLARNYAHTGNPVFPLANGVFHANPPGWGDSETQRWERGHALPPVQSSLRARIGLLWERIPGDPYQRFGPAILLVGILGLYRRKRESADIALIVVLILQLLVWTFGTHLYARFAMPMLIPLAFLAGRAAAAGAATVRTWILGAAVLSGAAFNFAHVQRLYAWEHSPTPDASLFYGGRLPGFEHFRVVNRELPADARILLVGEARAFYFERSVDYCTAFNRNSFAEAVAQAKEPTAIISWLREHGYTHVLVNWSEVRRLARTYGFSDQIDPDLFKRLEGPSFKLIFRGDHEKELRPDLEIYEVAR